MRRWRQQPSGPVAIDWSHPSSRGLTFAQVGNAPFDLVRGIWGTSEFTRPGPEVFAGGIGLLGQGAGDFSFGDSTKILAAGADTCTLLSVPAVTNQPSLNNGMLGATTSNWNFGLRFASSYTIYFDAAGSAVCHYGGATHSLDLMLGKAVPVIGTYDGATGILYVGPNVVSNAHTGTFVSGQKFAILNRGGGGSNTSYCLNGAVTLANAVWNRALEPGEVQALIENPWQIFRPVRARRAYSIPSGGSVTGTAAITEGADSASATGALLVSGSAAITEGADAIAGTGALSVSGLAAVLEGGDIIVATGTAGSGATASIAELADTVAAVGGISVDGTAVIAEGADLTSGTGAVGTGAHGVIAEEGDAVAASGSITIPGAMALLEGDDLVAAVGALGLIGSALITEGDDIVYGMSTPPPDAACVLGGILTTKSSISVLFGKSTIKVLQ